MGIGMAAGTGTGIGMVACTGTGIGMAAGTASSLHCRQHEEHRGESRRHEDAAIKPAQPVASGDPPGATTHSGRGRGDAGGE